MTPEDITARTDELAALFRDRLGIRGSDLGRQVRRAGRLLPRAVAREARFIAAAAVLAVNPRLERMIDAERFAAAHVIVRDHLRGVDPAERRRARLIGIAAVISFNVIVVLALVLVVLSWRGFI